MKKIFSIADEYLKICNWKDLALIKFCLFATGLMVGTKVCTKKKKPVFFAALLIFIATYIPLMSKFVGFLFKKKEIAEDTEAFADYIPE